MNYEDISFMEQTPGVEPESFKLASQYLCPKYSYLVVVLHQLDDHPDVVRVVLDGDDPHDVGSILSIRVLAVLVGQNQTSISLVNLGATKVDRSAPGT